MKYSVTQIVKDVEITMDEIALNDSELEEPQDDSERAVIIESKIPDALRFILANADWSLMQPDVVLRSDDESEESCIEIVDHPAGIVGVITLPDKFLRLVYAKFGSWSRYVGQKDIISWDDPAYAKLSDPYCTGTPERPKVAIAFGLDGRCMELYTAKDTDDVLKIGYMTEPEIKADIRPGGVSGPEYYNVPDKVQRALVYYIAGLTWETYGEMQRAQAMISEANDIIGFTQQQQVTPVVQQQ